MPIVNVVEHVDNGVVDCGGGGGVLEGAARLLHGEFGQVVAGGDVDGVRCVGGLWRWSDMLAGCGGNDGGIWDYWRIAG